MVAVNKETLTGDIEAQVLADYPPNRIGPTWQVNEHGFWALPKRTLGWGVIEWISEHLLSPDGSGDPFQLTPEQARYVLWFYAVDEHGEFLYMNSVLQRLKGWLPGVKTP